MQTTINTYACISKPTVLSIITITDWLYQIKSSKYSNLIENARTGLIDYDTTKALLPCVTYNFTYNGYKKDDNIIATTGLIYIDVDASDFNINCLDLTKIYSYYHSFGGKGYSLIVQVAGVTKENFKSTYLSISNDLGITEYVDTNAVKHSQFNVLSYDPNLFINESSFIYKSTTNNIFTPPSVVNKKEKKTYTIEGG